MCHENSIHCGYSSKCVANMPFPAVIAANALQKLPSLWL